MALGYTIAAILKRNGHIFFDDKVCVKIDWLEQLNRHYARVQGRDCLYIKFIAEELGLEGSYVPRTYIEQIQLEKLLDEVMALQDDLKTKLSIEDELVSSNPKEVLSRASADRVTMRNKNLKSRLSHTYSTRGNNNLNLTRLAVNNRRFEGINPESPAALTNQGFIIQLSEQITILNERMDEFTLRIEELNSKFTIRRVSNASHQNLALHAKACNGTATSLFVSGLGNGSLSGSLLPNSSFSSQLARDSPLMDEILLIKRGQVSFMDHIEHSLDSDSDVADTPGNIPSRGSKPLPDEKKKKKFTNVPGEFIHIVKRELELTFDLRRVANFSIMRRMNDAWKRHKSRLNKKYIKGKDPAKDVERNVPDEDVGRADVFIKAHTRADKTYQCPEIIEKLQVNMNLYPNLNKIGHDDVLAKTLDKDKKGHMMTMGIDITPSFVANAIHIVEENEDLKATNNELKNMLLNMRKDFDDHIKKSSGALQMQPYSSHNATSNSSQATQRKQSDLNRECKLNRCPEGIAAYGIIADVSPDAYCHNKQLRDGYYKIEIFNVINEDALLFRQDNSCEMTCFPRSLRLLSSFEVSHSSCSKTYGHSDLESAISHEDEALFGNLFSEEISSTYSSTDPRARIVFQRSPSS
ncbi:hypothetical protein GIB67_039684 [Kingdonia uniflora]|uniref:Uncharacterized protein n=1 Tax=Kingdonia uniflora TaxID=39325 RepID=A0A7J7MPW0_9MAGN|nr:hypothetical protein GIB67_039684 [Kingdonia uniflora]